MPELEKQNNMKTPPFKQKKFSGFGNTSKKDPVKTTAGDIPVSNFPKPPKTPSGFTKNPDFPKPTNPNVKFFRTNPFGKANATFTKTKRK